MALLVLRIDPKDFKDGTLSSHDIEIAGAVSDLFYMACLSYEFKIVGKLYFFEYDASIVRINYNSPLEYISKLKNIPWGLAQKVLNRVIYHKEEKEKKHIENDMLRQDLIRKKLDNLKFANSLRKELIEDGMDPDKVERGIAKIARSQNIHLSLDSGKLEKDKV